MTATRLRSTIAITALLVGVTPALAQREQATPEQRIERLEKQLRQVQRQVFPKGQPADTASFSDEPAATQSSFRTLDERLNGLERQLADVLRQSEENGHRVVVMETELGQLRSDQEQRIGALERAAAAATQVPVSVPVAEPAELVQKPKPLVTTGQKPAPAQPVATIALDPANDPAEIAYDEGFQLWRAEKYDAAIASLKAFSSAYPKHRRTSWANNLAGRALLDKGEPRAAAEALLANYRSNPKGERAPDSLYYLGQALMQLKQPTQACKAYSELEAVYGTTLRAELKRLLPPAKADARCS
ncbi:tetratricopeptide repeat protein [Sphingomonas sp.]|uniref:tetratricopeptide repeat protein n=1 Tax=Sphingomonas sp. TaxID=28214 RepID=UPI00286A39B4|nr:tetratricopeptide repeat protein [Sphingomonas sp.]